MRVVVHVATVAYEGVVERLRRLGSALAGPALAVVLFVVVGEIAARVLGIVDRLNGYSRVIFASGPDADMPYQLRAGIEATWAGVLVRTNSLGLRGPELPATPPAGARRVLLLGDSVMFGQGVDEADTVAGRLPALLGAPARPVEAVNAGVMGYDVVASARRLEMLGPALQPSAVVFGLSLNDYDTPPRYHPIGVLTRAASDESFVDRLELVVLGRWVAGWLRGNLWHQQIAGAASLGDEVVASLEAAIRAEHLAKWADPDGSSLERVRRGLARLRAASEALGADLLVAVFPESYQLEANPTVAAPQHVMQRLCEEAGVRCVDLRPAFLAAGGELFLDVQHPNAAGFAVAAQVIADTLRADASIE